MKEHVTLTQRAMTPRDVKAVNELWPKRLRPFTRRQFAEESQDERRFHTIFEASLADQKRLRRKYGGDAVQPLAGVLSGAIWSRSSLRNPDQGFCLSVYHWMVAPIWQHRGVGRQMFESLSAQLSDDIRAIRVHPNDLGLAFFLLRLGFAARSYNVAYSVEGITESFAEYEFVYPPSELWVAPGAKIHEFRLAVAEWGEPDADLYGLSDGEESPD